MWTRTYKNLIMTRAFCNNAGYNGPSTNGFGGEDYYFDFKDPYGVVREICNYVNYSNGERTYYAIKGMVYRNNSNDNSFTSAVGTIYNFATSTASRGYDTIYVGFGSSDAEASELDYALGSVISAYTRNTATASPVLNMDGTITINYQIIITATSDITIKEADFLCRVHMAILKLQFMTVTH